MFAESIDKEELKLLPVKSFEGELVIINEEKDLEPYIPYLFKQKMIGFDTETRPAFKKGVSNPVALLQLATDEYAFLIRLNKMKLPDTIRRILSDEQILKIGVAINNDFKAIRKTFKVEPAGFVDLQTLSEEYAITDNALTKLCGIILDFTISKAQRLTNWENEELTIAQQRYAATDAWACYEIYKKLNESEKIK